MCAVTFLRVFFLHVVGSLIFSLGVSFFSNTYTHMHAHNLPDKREKKSYSNNTTQNVTEIVFIPWWFLRSFFHSVLHNRISLCMCALYTVHTHAEPAAHIFPLSKSNAWRGKNSHFISGDLFKVMTQSKIILSFATMWACTCAWLNETHEVQENNKQTYKKSKNERKKERKMKQTTTANTNIKNNKYDKRFLNEQQKSSMPKIDCVRVSRKKNPSSFTTMPTFYQYFRHVLCMKE